MKEQNLVNIEQKALEYFLVERKKKGLSETAFGKLAFPETDNPRAKVNALYQVKTDKGKSLRLRLGDFCAMCQALNRNPPEELFRLWNGNEHD